MPRTEEKKPAVEGSLPPCKGIFPPEGGWVAKTTYLVKVAYSSGNPVHLSLFYSGFITNGKPAGYNQVWHPCGEDKSTIADLYYLEVVRVVLPAGTL